MNFNNNIKNNSNKKNMVILYLIVLTINLFYSFQEKMIHVYPDAFIPLSISAFFSGENWSQYVSTVPYYFGYGLALLYVPFFYLLKNPIHIYKSIIIFNNVIICIVPVIVYKLLNKYLVVKDRYKAFMISLIVSIMPGYIIMSKTTWNETAFIVIPWLVFFLLIYELNNTNTNRKIYSTILLAVLLIFGYSIHGRFIALIGTVFITILLYRIIYKKKLIDLRFFVPSMIILFILNNAMNNYLIKNLWLCSNKSELNNTIGGIIGQLLSSNIVELVKSSFVLFIGQSFYSQLETLGMITIGIILSLITIYKCVIKNKEHNVCEAVFIMNIFCFVIFILSIGMVIVQFTTLLISGEPIAGSYYIYGRYVETIYPLYLFMIFYHISNHKISKKIIINSVIIFIVILISFSFIVFPLIKNSLKFADMNTIMTYAFGGKYLIGKFEPGKALVQCTIVLVLMVTSVYALIYYGKQKIIYILFIVVYIFSSNYIAVNIPLYHSKNIYNDTITAYNDFNALGDIYNKYNTIYVIEDRDTLVSSFQFILPRYNVIKVNSKEVDNVKIKENSFIMSKKDYNFEFKYNWCYRVSDINEKNVSNNYVWAYGKELSTELVNYGNIKNQKNSYKEIDLSKLKIGDLDGNDSKNVQGSTLYLDKEKYIMGPWERFYEGEYEVIIKGSELKDLTADVCYNLGKNLIKINELEITNNYIKYTIKINKDTDNLEFRLWNNSNEIATINTIEVNKLNDNYEHN